MSPLIWGARDHAAPALDFRAPPFSGSFRLVRRNHCSRLRSMRASGFAGRMTEGERLPYTLAVHRGDGENYAPGHARPKYSMIRKLVLYSFVLLSFYVSGSPGFVFLNPLSLATDDCRSVLAVKGSLRRFAPWTAAGRSGRRGCLRGKGDVPASAGPDQRVRTSNPRLEFDCRHGFDVRVTPRDN